VTERPIALGITIALPPVLIRECVMPQPYQPSLNLSPFSGYITPIPCQYCKSNAHLIYISPHAELNAEVRTFECEDCGKQTGLIVLR
jgi:hypothetical protein